MKRLTIASIAVIVMIGQISPAAGSGKFDGEFADKKYLNDQAVFEFSVRQTGNALNIAFDAAYSNGHGATPDATGTGKVSGDSARFDWKDSHGNSGTGTITLAGDGIVVSMRPDHVADPRCLVFYRDNIKLTRIGKKKR